MFASLVALDGFYLLLSTQLTVDLTPEWSGGSMFCPLSHIYAKTPFCCVETVVNSTLVNALLFLINCEQMRHPLWIQLSHWQMFMQNGDYIAFWYLQLLCYLTQLQFTIWQNKFVEFLVFSRDNCRIWTTWAFSIICVCVTTFKVRILPLNHCFRWSRVQITFIKPLFCLNSIFSHQKAILYQHTKFRFFYCFENLQQ